MGTLDPLRDVVKSVLDAVGASATLTHTARTFTPATDQVAESTTTYDVKSSPPIRYKNNQIDGTVVRLGDFKVFVASKGVTIEEGKEEEWSVSVSGVSANVVRVNRVFPGDVEALMILQCRR